MIVTKKTISRVVLLLLITVLICSVLMLGLKTYFTVASFSFTMGWLVHDIETSYEHKQARRV